MDGIGSDVYMMYKPIKPILPSINPKWDKKKV
jgi:hypothetical protein